MPHLPSTADPGQADRLREAMTDKLIAGGWITSPAVEAAFRTVPRHEFTPPGTPLEVAYNADDSVITKRDASDAHLSSVSAPWLQARMIDQAGIGPGMRVLELGSGGYNAALLAEVTGEGGSVVSMDCRTPLIFRAVRGSLEHVLEQVLRTLEQTYEREWSTGSRTRVRPLSARGRDRRVPVSNRRAESAKSMVRVERERVHAAEPPGQFRGQVVCQAATAVEEGRARSSVSRRSLVPGWGG